MNGLNAKFPDNYVFVNVFSQKAPILHFAWKIWENHNVVVICFAFVFNMYTFLYVVESVRWRKYMKWPNEKQTTQTYSRMNIYIGYILHKLLNISISFYLSLSLYIIMYIWSTCFEVPKGCSIYIASGQSKKKS